MIIFWAFVSSAEKRWKRQTPGISPGVWQEETNQVAFDKRRRRRRTKLLRPTNPVPSKPNVPGSGTDGVPVANPVIGLQFDPEAAQK